MNILSKLAPQRAAIESQDEDDGMERYMLSKAMGAPSLRDETTGRRGPDTERIPDATQLREWALNHPLVFAALLCLIHPVVGQPWAIRPTVPLMGNAEDVHRVMAKARRLLANPNVNGLNQSFRTFWESILFDVVVINNGALMLQRNGYDEIHAMHAKDGSLVHFVTGWEGPEDGPRYKVRTKDGWQYFDNRDIVTIGANSVTFDQRGIPVLRVLHDTLTAEAEIFLAQWQKQKRDAPAGILNLPKAQKGLVEATETYYKRRVEGRSTIGVANLPADTQFIKIGNGGGPSTWREFTDVVVRRICAALGLLPSDLGWTVGTHEATAEFETEKSAERSIKPRADLMAEFINREILPSFGSPLIAFEWTGTGSKDQMRMAQIIAQLSATKNWGINEMRRMWGDEPLLYDDPMMQLVADSPIIESRILPPVPLPIYAAQMRQQFPDFAARLDADRARVLVEHGVPQRTIREIPRSNLPALRRTKDEDEIKKVASEYGDQLNALLLERWA